MRNARPAVQEQYPELGQWIYASRGTPFIAGSIGFLLPVTVLRLVGWDKIAEPFAMASFFMICIGTVLYIWSVVDSKEKLSTH